MEIKGKVHCFFEQSGTFKNEFIKLGIPAEDYDIQNGFGQTENIISADYARNFICDFILGKQQKGLSIPQLFKI
ncbi:hypothetical protein [Prevotella sp.]|uniref:hypothetical protein n=1 Tax=Prevotella sp. TaxID=59823 RepID=UPI0027E327B4|nr:hypothetical protein [Prevotella sp.]